MQEAPVPDLRHQLNRQHMGLSLIKTFFIVILNLIKSKPLISISENVREIALCSFL